MPGQGSMMPGQGSMMPGQGTSPPPPAGKVELFDVGIQTLRIESPNGVTTRSTFVPTAASFTDANNSKTPNQGDTGILQGLLSGIAFTQTGNLVTFSDRDTVLNFTLDAFSSNFKVGGSLISPKMAGDAPLVFLPGLNNVTVQGNNFIATSGELQVGNFSADLDNGLIDLPATLTFRDTGGVTIPPTSDTIARRIKFKFEGQNLAANSYLFDSTASGAIRFVGQANQKFEIQTVGSSGTQDFKFKIQGQGGIVDATLGVASGSVALIDDGLALDRFEIKGKDEGELGIASVFRAYGTSGLAFSGVGNEGKTKYKFEQGNSRVEGETTSVSFRAYPGLSQVNQLDIDTNDSYEFEDFESSNEDQSNQTCSVCGVTLNINNNVKFGSTSISLTNNQIQYNSGGGVIVFTGSGAGSAQVAAQAQAQGQAQAQAQAQAQSQAQATSTSSGSVNSFNANVSGLAGSSSTAQGQYEISNSARFNSVSTAQGRVKVRYVEQGGDRYLVASRTNRGATLGRQGYKLVGPSSRCFPGLVGLRQIPDQETETVCQTGSCSEDDDTAINSGNTNNVENNTNTNTGDDDNGDDDNGDDDDDSQSLNNQNRNANQGIGNGPEGADPGNSRPHGGSNDEGGRTPGGRDR